MARSKTTRTTLSSLVESDSDDDNQSNELSTMPTPDSAAENKPVAKSRATRGKSNTAKVTNTKATSGRAGGRLTAKLKDAASVPVKRGKRTAPTDKANQQNTSDAEEGEEEGGGGGGGGGEVEEEAEEEFDETEKNEDSQAEDIASDELDQSSTVAKEQSKAARGTAKKKGTTKATDTVEVETPEETEVESRVTKKKPASKKARSKVIEEEIIPETQTADMDIDEEENEHVENEIAHQSRRVSHIHSGSRHTSGPRTRAGSVSDTEHNDPALRRKLGEMTKKFESLEAKYRDLRELGLREAERNFERLKKQGEERTKVANELISSLKTDLATQTELAKSVQKHVETIKIKDAQLLESAKDHEKLREGLAAMKAENKTLAAKLAANRLAAASVESTSAKVPASAAKTNGVIKMVGSVEAAQTAQAAQLKEDLYSDLTGLIIRSVRRESEEDIFDCIQTGRNGTLHFKLAIGNEKAGESYDDAHCVYSPQLDPSRDSMLMETLPDYLVDEITFPRSQAAKFYARVMKSLTEKVDKE
ncbi:chromosome segregation protein Csm1/Pcs1-domain-containing protein [Xylogone sp. PMI_703]|nr:chromosome segregation protein Csm1/Pcs1-domain-containing protein [Xylogone sp. PMI_703]